MDIGGRTPWPACQVSLPDKNRVNTGAAAVKTGLAFDTNCF